MKNVEKTIETNSLEIGLVDLRDKVKRMTVTIVGDGELVLNKMNARNVRALTDRKKLRETPNMWEDLITAIHWRDPLPMKNTYEESNEDIMHRLLVENAPCISAFGLKKSFCDAVVRVTQEKKTTAFAAAFNIVGDLVPIKFTGWDYYERLMSPKHGSPVNVTMNKFYGWEATFSADFLDTKYSMARIVDIINMAGFSLGIGSGRSTGYGRYHVTNVSAQQ